MNAEHHFDDHRNSRKPEDDVTVFSGIWVCPACREVNSEEKQKCIACGQRVVHGVGPIVARSNTTATDHERDAAAAPKDEARLATEPFEEIRNLAHSINDWICPACGATVHGHTCPNSQLQWIAKLLLVDSFFAAAICFFIVMAIGNWIERVFFPFDGEIKLALIFLPSIVLSWWALSLPRVVALRCTQCGSRHRQFRAAPGFRKAGKSP
ncbi:MAG: zinc finger protein [Thermoguttaceae bacterium]